MDNLERAIWRILSVSLMVTLWLNMLIGWTAGNDIFAANDKSQDNTDPKSSVFDKGAEVLFGKGFSYCLRADTGWVRDISLDLAMGVTSAFYPAGYNPQSAPAYIVSEVWRKDSTQTADDIIQKYVSYFVSDYSDAKITDSSSLMTSSESRAPVKQLVSESYSYYSQVAFCDAPGVVVVIKIWSRYSGSFSESIKSFANTVRSYKWLTNIVKIHNRQTPADSVPRQQPTQAQTKRAFAHGINIDIESPIVSRNARDYAYAIHRGDWRAVINGITGPAFARLIEPVSSPSGRRFAYVAGGNAWSCVVVDGKIGQRFGDIISSSLIFSPDGSKLAYIAIGNGKYHVVIDDSLSPPFDGILAGTPIFSSDSRSVAYGALDGEENVVVVNGRRFPSYNGIAGGGVAMSRDGGRIAYSALRRGKWIAVIDGLEGPESDGITADTPIFSFDGSRSAYGMVKDGQWVAVVDGKNAGNYDGIRSMVFSPDGKHLAYVVRTSLGECVVQDGKLGPSYDGIGDGVPLFSRDSRRIAYVATKSDHQVVVVDHIPGRQHDWIGAGSVSFSPDGKHVTYIAATGQKQSAVVDDLPGPLYDGIDLAGVLFSADGNHVAYCAQLGKQWLLVLDGREGTRYEDILPKSLGFSLDSKQIAYVAVKGAKKSLVLNGVEGPWVDDIVPQIPSYDSSNTMRYLAIDKDSISGVEQIPLKSLR